MYPPFEAIVFGPSAYDVTPAIFADVNGQKVVPIMTDNNDGSWTVSNPAGTYIKTVSWQTNIRLTRCDIVLTAAITSLNSAWYGCTALHTVDTSNLGEIEDVTTAWYGCLSLSAFDASGLTKVKNITQAWRDCIELVSFTSGLGLKNVTNGTAPWYGCLKLFCFDKLDTTGYTERANMLGNCKQLQRPDVHDQAILESAGGMAYINPHACP